MLQDAGIAAELDATHGFDHGVFVPLRLMYPEAAIPCLQLSLVRGLDAGLHVRMGKALAGLRARNVLIVGSGFSFHNLRAFFSSRPGIPDTDNESFQDWLVEPVPTPVCQNRRARHVLSSGSRRRMPATATRARNTCCRCMFATG